MLQRGVALIAGGDLLLARFAEPLLDKGAARRGGRLQLMLALDEAVAVVFEIAQQFGFLVGCRQEVEATADLGRGKGRAHLLDFLGELGAVGVARLVVFQLGDRRGVLRNLFVVGADLAFALRLALLVIGSLQLDVAVRRRILRWRRIVGAVGQLGLAPRDLRI